MLLSVRRYVALNRPFHGFTAFVTIDRDGNGIHCGKDKDKIEFFLIASI